MVSEDAPRGLRDLVAGILRGGDGVVREVELLAPARVTLLTERRRLRPYGLQSRSPGKSGLNLLTSRPVRVLPGKATLHIATWATSSHSNSRRWWLGAAPLTGRPRQPQAEGLAC
jgi:Hydantoinase B/oxoprolinase